MIYEKDLTTGMRSDWSRLFYVLISSYPVGLKSPLSPGEVVRVGVGVGVGHNGGLGVREQKSATGSVRVRVGDSITPVRGAPIVGLGVGVGDTVGNGQNGGQGGGENVGAGD